jgi:Flp pilus assembly protein TadG
MKINNDTRGQAAVETALMIIFVIIGLMILLLDGGPLILDWMMAKELSARGARAAAIYLPGTDADGMPRTCISDVEAALGEQTMPFAVWNFTTSDNCDDFPGTVFAPGEDITVTIHVVYTIPFAVDFGLLPTGEEPQIRFNVSTTDQAR